MIVEVVGEGYSGDLVERLREQTRRGSRVASNSEIGYRRGLKNEACSPAAKIELSVEGMVLVHESLGKKEGEGWCQL